MQKLRRSIAWMLVLGMFLSVLGTVNVSADENKLNEFVKRLYTITLEREPSDEEVAFWAESLLVGATDGANAAYTFVFGEEFTMKNVDDAEFVKVLYRTLFGREADQEGYEVWMGYLDDGVTREGIFKGFVESEEFALLCSWYGITPGTIKPTEIRDVNVQITAYVARCYEKILGRKADVAGLNVWTNLLLTGNAAGSTIVNDFIKSEEFAMQNLDVSAQIDRVYMAMLNREPDADGKNAWLTIMQDGAQIIDVVAGFSKSEEFAILCGRYGIAPGTVAGSGYVQVNKNIRDFVDRCYLYALGREADAAGFADWCYKVADNTLTAEQCAHGFVFSEECTGRNLNNDEFLRMLYKLCFNREPDEGGYNIWIKILNNGASREAVFYSFTNATEFVMLVESFGLSHTPVNVVLAESKKGIQGVDYLVCDPNPEELGVKHVLFNLDLTKCINPNNDSYPWPYKGENYYFNSYVNQQAEMCNLLESQGVDVTMVLLMSYDSNLSYLTYTGHEGGNRTYYAWNLQNAEARKRLEGTLAFLFTEAYPTVDNWVIGNEVNMPNHYNYTGTTDLNVNADVYAEQMVFVYNVLKENTKNPDAKVYMSLDHSWGHDDEGRGIAGNKFLPAVASAIERKQAGVEWHVAYHAYAPIMQHANMWNSEYLNHSFDTPFICGSNLEVLTNYIRDNYGANHRVILSEQGITAADGENAQAAGIAYTYYAGQFNDMVDAVIFRSYTDDRNDGSFTFGLRSAYWQDILSGAVSIDNVGYRESYNVFKYMDTPQSSQYLDKYLGTVGSDNWSKIVPGYNVDAFKYMY